MAGDALAAEEHLDRGGGEARPDAMADEGVRHAVVMPIDIDVVIEGDGALLPLGVTRTASAAARASPAGRAPRRRCAASPAVAGTADR